ncbi:DUF1007 family protein [Aurantimonas sp. VKM B-3413]|uniref:DUF1007 family protein n=1 Tax=Aurantimonas sp. VKM B-3413 TaxID=2779401 RepID=UPI001E4EEEFA
MTCGAAPAFAHPHVFANAEMELVGDGHGRLMVLRNIWHMDELFAATVLAEFDANKNGAFDEDELAAVARKVGQSVADYSFFTFLRTGDQEVALDPPASMGAAVRDGQLLIYFEMPLVTPFDVTTQPLAASNFDETFYVAFDYAGEDSFVLSGLPDACRKTLVVPDEEEAAQKWAQDLYPDAESAPADGVDYAKLLAGRLELDCTAAPMATAKR